MKRAHSNLESLIFHNEIPKKRREKKRTEIPRGQPSDSILPLSKGWHNAWRCKPRSRPARGAFRLVLLPLSCSRAPEQAQPGEPVSSVLPVFSTPPSPPLPRAIHDHTLELFPMVNVIIYRSSDRDLSGLPCYIYIYKKDCDSSECNY